MPRSTSPEGAATAKILVIAVDDKEVKVGCCGAGDSGHEVVRLPVGHFPDLTGRMSANGVEVTERDKAGFADLREIPDDLLAHLFGPGVRTLGFAEGRVFSNRQFARAMEARL